MLIFVNSTLTGKTFSLEVESDDPVSIIKAAIYGHEGVQPEYQYLILAGTKLSDSGTLAENDVHEECTLDLDVRLGYSGFTASNIALAQKYNQKQVDLQKMLRALAPARRQLQEEEMRTQQRVEAKVEERRFLIIA